MPLYAAGMQSEPSSYNKETLHNLLAVVQAHNYALDTTIQHLVMLCHGLAESLESLAKAGIELDDNARMHLAYVQNLDII